ncbi:putative mediator complex, subunit Med21, mediator complex, subunit Med7/Med21 [Helianthus annuus]|nr:putative mediator complex, subunit Med21, mediator complex, subunit Med7/Med21 [Helianthus annuus]
MDIISQLQEQVNTIAAIAFNTFGTLQRDAPPVRLSPNYPEPPSAPAAAAGGAPANGAAANPSTEELPSNNISETPKLLSAELVKAAKQFDALVAALPFSEGGEEAQLKKIEQLQISYKKELKSFICSAQLSQTFMVICTFQLEKLSTRVQQQYH